MTLVGLFYSHGDGCTYSAEDFCGVFSSVQKAKDALEVLKRVPDWYEDNEYCSFSIRDLTLDENLGENP